PATPAAAAAAERLNQTAVAQPALFAVEYALARLWMEWGITPRALLGYSLGEYVAACLAGVFSLEDALMLVARRARMIQELPAGAMLAVPLAEEEIGDLLGGEGGLSLAAINGPRQSVLAGPVAAVEAAEAKLALREVASRRLPTTHAFHSTMMEPIAAAYEAVVRTVSLHPPTIPYVSNLTGGWARPEEVTDPAYWARHMREAVRFADGVRELWQEPGRVLLEVGPGLSLSSLAKLHPACDAEAARRVLASLPASYVRQPDSAFLLGTLGRLWLTGVPIDWSGFYAHERRRRVPLPTYPFERQRYWIDGAESEEPAGGAIPGLEKKSDIGDWFYRPVWEPAPLPELPGPAGQVPAGDWLVLEDGLGLGESLAGRLTAEGRSVLRVRPGAAWARVEAGLYIVRPGEREDWDALLADLRGQGRRLAGVVHLWGLTGAEELEVDAALELCFYSLLTLAQALGRLGSTDPLRLLVVTDRLQQVHPGEAPCPEKAVILGPARVIPQEYPHIACCAIDVEPAADAAGLVELLLPEILGVGSSAIVAYRGRLRSVLGYEPVKLDAPVEGVPRLRQGGVYLITGGLGGVGLVIAEHLARTVHAKLVLTRRSPLPERSLWPEWLAGHGEDDPASGVIRKVWRLEELGAEVLVAVADAVDGARMRAVVEEAEARFGGIGAIHGVLHAAGIGGGGLIQLKTRRAAAEVLAPKVLGARVLDEIFRQEGRAGLDFLLLFSSLQTALGDFGQVDYCAANAYLDSLALANTVRGPFTLALGWDNWQEVGIAVNAEVPEHLKAWRAEILAKGILPAEGTEVFDRALAADLPQVVVTTQDLTARIAQSHSYTGDRVMQQLGGPGAGAGAAPAGGRSSAVLGGTHIPARGELERRVTAV
ncbi:MAG TPA: KR domain-containing protein, partial [Thermoanaerobaculia bacterium]|nr:KR domain-containing protein [Thermoanaerobaculia bacterium]